MTPDSVDDKKLYLRIILPFRLPTWNSLLAMNHWERKKVRDWIKNAISKCIAEGSGLQTSMVSVLRLRLTDLSKQEYLKMIQPKAQKSYRLRKRNARLAKKKKR